MKQWQLHVHMSLLCLNSSDYKVMGIIGSRLAHTQRFIHLSPSGYGENYSYCYLSFVEELSLSQTLPADNSPACPGQTMEFVCTSAGGWVIDGQTIVKDELPTNISNFHLKLTSENGLWFNSSARINVTSDEDGEVVKCVSGGDIQSLTVDVQGLMYFNSTNAPVCSFIACSFIAVCITISS